MRKACLQSVYELAKADERVIFIGSDTTKQGLERFAADFPNRFFMEGIYEAHVIGMAAGMALCGKIPYINTIATFLTRRCYEQVLIDVCLHNLPVRLLGSGGGTVYAPLGPTHLATEDIAIFRAIPNMTIVAPCDAEEMKRVMTASLTWPGPMYVRIAKGGDKVVSSDRHPFAVGRAVPLREGAEVLLVTTGVTAQVALDAAVALESDGIDAGVLHLHTVKPFDADAVLSRARDAHVVLALEEHTVIGGLGSAVAEALMECGVSRNARFARLGFPDVFTDELGSQAEIMGKYGLKSESVVGRVKRMLKD